MDRRTYLRRLTAAGALVALAGCTEQALEDAKQPAPALDARYHEEELPLPVERQFDVVAAAVERAGDVTFDDTGAFGDYLRDAELAVETLEESEVHGTTVLELEYVPDAPARRGNAHSLGLVAGGYAALVRGGYDREELVASLLEPDGRSFGEYEVVTDWAAAYNEGAKTAAVYGGKVLHTLEST